MKTTKKPETSSIYVYVHATFTKDFLNHRVARALIKKKKVLHCTYDRDEKLDEWEMWRTMNRMLAYFFLSRANRRMISLDGCIIYS